MLAAGCNDLAVAANHEILALFDLDGTLLRAGDPVHHAAFEHACRLVFGVEIDVTSLELAGAVDRRLYEQAAALTGMDERDAAARFGEWVAVVGRFYRLRVHEGDRLSWVLPGAADVLRKLRATGIAMAVGTGSVREVAELKLSTSGLSDYFPVGAFGDEVTVRSELVTSAVGQASRRYGRKFLAANAVVIGDTPADITAARETGARVVAIATGRFDVDELDALGPDAVFADLTNADAVIKAIREPNSLN
ncbi:MAG: HAD family hydrolase [Acidimicrobiales bacterium]